MATKWEINKAVRASSLPAPARLILLTLSDIAEAGTAEIPEQHTPSLRVLSEEAGLSKATVARHLTDLESGGWITRNRPTIEASRHDHARTTYRLTIPEQTEHVSEKDMPVSERDKSMSQRETRHVSQEDMGMSHSETLPYIPDHYQTITTSSSPPPAGKAPKKRRGGKRSGAGRVDVERVCEHLANRIVANGCKRPTVTEEWRDEARRLIDIDGRTADQVIRCIDWATNDSFWRKNILSMPKLRAKYDQLRLAAESERDRTQPGRHQTYRNPVDSSIYEGAL